MVKPLIPITLIIIVLGGTLFYFGSLIPTSARITYLLKEDLEFCEVVKESIQGTKGEFWLICNNRPFYTVYNNGVLTKEMNGWGFLKEQPEVLTELNRDGCNFYNYANSELVFVCKSKMVKTYRFSTSDFKLNKIDETRFFNYFLELNRYDCDAFGSSVFDINNESFIQLDMECGGYDTIISFNLDKMYFTLPTIIDETLTNKEKAEMSFRLINFCELRRTQDMGTEALAFLSCKDVGDPRILFDFEFGFSNFLIDKSEFEGLLPFLWRYNLPSLEGGELQYAHSLEDSDNKFYLYQFDNSVVIAKELKDSSMISEIYSKHEGF